MALEGDSIRWAEAPGRNVTTTEHPTPQQAVLELQARARDHALGERVGQLERVVARVHARIDGALVTVVPKAMSSGASTGVGSDNSPGAD